MSLPFQIRRRGRARRCGLLAALTVLAVLSMSAAAQAADPPSWQEAQVVGDTMTGVSCPSATECVGVSDLVSVTQGPSLYLLDSPETDTNSTTIKAVSCATTTFCMLVDDVGNAFSYDGGTDDSALSSLMTVDAGHALTSVACPSATLCFATASDGSIYTWTGGTSWTLPAADKHLLATGGLDSPMVSCISTTICIAAGDNGSAMVSHLYSSGTWASTGVTFDSGTQGLDSLDCTSGGVCVTGDDRGDSDVYSIVTSAWATPRSFGGTEPVWIGCASTACQAIDFNDNQYSTVNVTIAADWGHATDIHGTTGLTVPGGVSCVSATVCVAVDGLGQASTYTVPLTEETPPTISGTPAVGQTLTVNPGTWEAPGVALDHAWWSCEQPHSACLQDTGDASDTLTSADQDDYVEVREAAGIGMDVSDQEDGISDPVGPVTGAGGTQTTPTSTSTTPTTTTPTSTTPTTTTTPPPPTPVVLPVVSFSSDFGPEVDVAMKCPGTGTETCPVTLTLQVTEKLQGKRVVAITAVSRRRVKTTTKTVTVGTASYTITPQEPATLPVTLSAAWKRTLNKRGSLPVKLIATSGGKTVFTRTVKLSKPHNRNP